jgi:hypothetical protein
MIQENSLEADVDPSPGFRVLDDVQSKRIQSDLFAELYEEAEREKK